MYTRNVLAAAMTAAIGSGLFFTSTTSASADPSSSAVQVAPHTAAKPEMAPTQLRKVRPIPFYQPKQLPLSEVAPFSAPAAPGSASDGRPDASADETARREFPRAWRNIPRSSSTGHQSDFSVDFGTRDTYTAYAANAGLDERLLVPHRAIGKLVTNSGSCSASVISGRNIIVTAAHCCYTRGVGWNSGFRFYPAYRNGEYSLYGSFPWTSARVVPTWISRGARQDDICLISLGNNQFGRPVTYYTGWLGRQWDWPSARPLFALGYPGNLGNGQVLQLCAAESFSPSAACGGSTVLNMGCNMTYGASGGPWIEGYRGGNWVNSVVSGYDNTTCTGTFGQSFNGPRFTSTNIVPLCNLQGC